MTANPAPFPKNYFRSPVQTPIRLTGNFGELRDDHFHSGIDIDAKNNRIGQPVLAAAGGYVARVKVQSGGYGNALYIKHPNGYTTLYAHLDRFAPAIQAWVRAKQYKAERFEVDLNPKPGQFPVAAGQEIGKLGNTGGSSGPHLHFEIRDGKTGNTLNPELFGLKIPDNIPPDIRELRVYFLNEKREVLAAKPVPVVQKPDGTFAPKSGDELAFGTWRIALGVKAYDKMTGVANDNGIFSLQVLAEGQPVFEYKTDELDLDITRYVNAHVDFPEKEKNDAWFHRCFQLPGDQLPNYSKTESGGAIPIFKDKPVRIVLRVTDASGNVSELKFAVTRDEGNMEKPAPPPHRWAFPIDSEQTVEAEGLRLSAPKGAFYETAYVNLTTSTDRSDGIFSKIFHLGDAGIPVHRFMEIALPPNAAVPENLKSKIIIAKCQPGGQYQNCGGAWAGDRVATKLREFGDYCLMADTQAPEIEAIAFAPNMKKKGEMAFRVRDNFDVGGSADGLSFRGTVDGKWVLFAFDRKANRLTHVFDGHVAPGKHLLRLVVRDDRGNEGVFEGEFSR